MAAIETPIDSGMEKLERTFGAILQLAEPKPCVLSISESQTDHASLGGILNNTQWRLFTAKTCGEALEQLHSIGALVIFCECRLPDGGWKDVLERISGFEEPPFLVVTSTLADEVLWSEVLNLGGYDVLSKPLVTEEVQHVLASIWNRRARPHSQTRALPAAS